ncbi:MAG: hypothetical protein KBT47_01560, partial [Armatimonadetes bacterium]|nr:hypothetical protein [Candidatus Hippobium faecium]
SIDTDNGGKIVSMKDSEGKEWLKDGFMLGDLTVEQPYNQADLLNKPHSHSIKEEGSKKIISLSATIERPPTKI